MKKTTIIGMEAHSKRTAFFIQYNDGTKISKRKKFINHLSFFICAALITACNEGTSQPADGSTDEVIGGITLSGKLVAGTQKPVTPPPPRYIPPPPPAPGDPLVGYKLYCVTFTNPPVAAAGTSDAAGQVSLDIDASGVALGCFVLDTSGEAVAALVFSSGPERGQTITLTGDADLGTITVDLDNGIAQADITEVGTITGSDDMECPLGTWTATVPREECTGTATSYFVIFKNSEGQYRMSFRVGPLMLPSCDCCEHALSDIPGTASGGALTFSFPGDMSCPTKIMTVTLTPNADCTEMTGEVSLSGCLACQTQGCDCGGDLTCPQPSITAIRN